MARENEIMVYQPDSSFSLEVRIDDETVWQHGNQMAALFDIDVKTIGKHINNALKIKLQGLPAVANFARVQIEGRGTVKRTVEFYNLDVIISVGYRVKSFRGTQFRQWANKVLEEYNIGASLKDLGKKLFAFVKMETSPDFLLDNLTSEKL